MSVTFPHVCWSEFSSRNICYILSALLHQFFLWLLFVRCVEEQKCHKTKFQENRCITEKFLSVPYSLLCVKKHKEDSGCSGVRNKTAFVALSQFDQMTLLNGEPLFEIQNTLKQHDFTSLNISLVYFFIHISFKY